MEPHSQTVAQCAVVQNQGDTIDMLAAQALEHVDHKAGMVVISMDRENSKTHREKR